MTAACNLLEAEIALDRIEAELAAEMPAHMRAFSAAYARGEAPPPAPAVLHRASTLTAANNALAHPVLEDRGLALQRLAMPIVIEDDPRVIAARSATPTWSAYRALVDARDVVAVERTGLGFVTNMHRLFGVQQAPRVVDWPAPIEGWTTSIGATSIAELVFVSGDLHARYGADGRIDIVLTKGRARTFVIRHGEAIVHIPDTMSPATRFAALHEFGHALVAILSPLGVPRVVDEAAAAYIARDLEQQPGQWHSPLAKAARDRRLQLAIALDAIERRATTIEPTEKPPWALWHDPGAQAAYIEAEAIADRWMQSTESLASLIAAERTRIDAMA